MADATGKVKMLAISTLISVASDFLACAVDPTSNVLSRWNDAVSSEEGMRGKSENRVAGLGRIWLWQL